eukprot:scaffold81739_cov67-Cyclotella_meneghiniana.AAC.9
MLERIDCVRDSDFGSYEALSVEHNADCGPRGQQLDRYEANLAFASLPLASFLQLAWRRL